MSLSLLVAPSGQVVTTAEAKAQMRVTHSAEDGLIDSMIAAATAEAEHLTQRCLLTQQWRLTLDAWQTSVRLTRPPITSVVSVKYIDGTSGVQTTMSSSDYALTGVDDTGAYLTPVYGTTWPAARGQADAIEIIYSAGYANAGAVPQPIKTWILMRVAAYFRNREAWTMGQRIERNEHLDRMLDRYTTETI